MSKIISLEQWKQQKAAEAMVVQCGPEKVHIIWIPKLSEEDLQCLRKAGDNFRNAIKKFQDVNKV